MPQVINNVSEAVAPVDLKISQKDIAKECIYQNNPVLVIGLYDNQEEVGFIVFNKSGENIGGFYKDSMIERAKQIYNSHIWE